MEHAGSKHLMECPVWWANKLFQIKRNSRCEDCWTNCPPPPYWTSSQLEKEESWEKANFPCFPFFGAAQAFFICNQLQLNSMRGVSGLGATLECIKYLCISELFLHFKKKESSASWFMGTTPWGCCLAVSCFLSLISISAWCCSSVQVDVWTWKSMFIVWVEAPQRLVSDRCAPWPIKVLSDSYEMINRLVAQHTLSHVIAGNYNCINDCCIALIFHFSFCKCILYFFSLFFGQSQ